MLASHVNKRIPGFFAPFVGRVAEPTEKNVSIAKNNQLEPVSFPWLNGTMEKAVQPSIEAVKRCSAHPATKRTHPRLFVLMKHVP